MKTKLYRILKIINFMLIMFIIGCVVNDEHNTIDNGVYISVVDDNFWNIRGDNKPNILGHKLYLNSDSTFKRVINDTYILKGTYYLDNDSIFFQINHFESTKFDTVDRTIRTSSMFIKDKNTLYSILYRCDDSLILEHVMKLVE